MRLHLLQPCNSLQLGTFQAHVVGDGRRNEPESKAHHRETFPRSSDKTQLDDQPHQENCVLLFTLFTLDRRESRISTAPKSSRCNQQADYKLASTKSRIILSNNSTVPKVQPSIYSMHRTSKTFPVKRVGMPVTSGKLQTTYLSLFTFLNFFSLIVAFLQRGVSSFFSNLSD